MSATFEDKMHVSEPRTYVLSMKYAHFASETDSSTLEVTFGVIADILVVDAHVR
jgi:hypothetical protein